VKTMAALLFCKDTRPPHSPQPSSRERIGCRRDVTSGKICQL
jgi:hypothetical protein